MKIIRNNKLENIFFGFGKIEKKITDKKKSKIYSSIYNNGQDFMMLSVTNTFYRLRDMLENKVSIICNLKDRNGKIGEKIVKVSDNENRNNESYDIYMKRDITHKIHDRYLYNIIYNEKKKVYSLEEHDEYFEKITRL
jgi:tRNA-binding EMAP/Myf-like protein